MCAGRAVFVPCPDVALPPVWAASRPVEHVATSTGPVHAHNRAAQLF